MIELVPQTTHSEWCYLLLHLKPALRRVEVYWASAAAQILKEKQLVPFLKERTEWWIRITHLGFGDKITGLDNSVEDLVCPFEHILHQADHTLSFCFGGVCLVDLGLNFEKAGEDIDTISSCSVDSKHLFMDVIDCCFQSRKGKDSDEKISHL